MVRPAEVTAQDAVHAAEAYRRGLWVHTTLADALGTAATETPDRIVLVDKDVRLDCATLYTQARALAGALLARMPTGGIVSFMLPNWHESAVIYLAATLAGMVVNPILPSLRDRDLRYILEDAGTAVVFVPQQYGGHDYLAMLDRVTAAMNGAPEVVVLRGEAGPHTAVCGPAGAAAPGRGPAHAGSRRRADDPVHLRHHQPAERCPAHP